MKVHESKERLDVANCYGYGLNGKDSKFGRIWGDAGYVNDVAQIKNLVAKKLTLRRFEFEAGAENTSDNGV